MPLPTEKSRPMPRVGKVFLYALPKLGKSTLASTMEPEKTLLLDVEDGLNAIEGYKAPIKSWGRIVGVEGEGRQARPILADDSFRGVIRDLAIEVTERRKVKEEPRFSYAVVDTVDALSQLCNDYVLSALGAGAGQQGYVHASDFDYGKGWGAINEEWKLRLGALCMVVPNVILISHADEVTKTDRTGAEYGVFTPTLGPKGVRKWTLGFVEHILFLNVERDDDGEDQRVIHTQPSRSWEAGGRTPIGGEKLPESIWLPDAATSGTVLREALERVSGALPAEKPKEAQTPREADGAPEAARKEAEGAPAAKKAAKKQTAKKAAANEQAAANEPPRQEQLA